MPMDDTGFPVGFEPPPQDEDEGNVNDYDLDDGQESKRQKTDLEDMDDGYVVETNRQKKQFQKNPEIFLAKKLSSSEVHWKNLSPEERRLMTNAKGGEVSPRFSGFSTRFNLEPKIK
ncbi:Uncharacterized protein SCF082_LOCUS11426 [Durusdinium trenchii]|uniref:Uncharacterized protein n=1 Tax=Durusdinium trenchii TaxID=1381693 RepID=A0ABP0JCU2_9DINO